MRNSLRPAPALLALVLLACSGEETSLLLHFMPDPVLNTEAQLLSAIDRVQLVLDADGGFAGVSTAAQGAGPWTAAQRDGDKELELELTRSIAAEQGFPELRILPGQNGDRAFRIAAYGLVGTKLVALGGTSTTTRFREGGPTDVAIPFNLRASYRAPRVLLSVPADGTTTTAKGVGRLHLELSTVVTTDSLRSGLQVYFRGTSGERLLQGNVITSTQQLQELGITDTRSIVEFEGPCPFGPGSYRVVLSTQVKDLAGRALDQDAQQPGANAYQGTFTVPGTAGADPCSIRPEGCNVPEDCNPPGQKLLTCQITDKPPGVCVPAKEVCVPGTTTGCPKGYICLGPTIKDGLPSCVQDCRLVGGACTQGFICNKTTGICDPCKVGASGEQCAPPPPPTSTCPKCDEICKTDPVKCKECRVANKCT